MSVVIDNGRAIKPDVIKLTIKLTKTEETILDSSKLGQRRSRSTGRAPTLNRLAIRCPTRDRSAESHLLYRTCATDTHRKAAQVLNSSKGKVITLYEIS